MSRLRVVVALAFATLLSCNEALGNALKDINAETLHTLEKRVLVDYRPVSKVGTEGKPLVSLDSKNSFAVRGPGGISTYMLAITYAPKHSEFDRMESQCELPIYTTQNRLVSRVVRSDRRKTACVKALRRLELSARRATGLWELE